MAESRKVYAVKVSEAAADFIRVQPKKFQRQIRNKIRMVAEDPYNKGSKIKSSADLFKTRSGHFRIAYQIKKQVLLILVASIGHRKDFYKYYER